MNVSPAGIAAIEEREGKSNIMYLDQAGFPTIGVGHELTRDERRSGKVWLPSGAVDWGAGLTDDQVAELLRRDLDVAEQAIDTALFRPDLMIELRQNQFDALVSFVFNIGVQAFRDSTLLRHLRIADFAAVPVQMRRWVYDAGHVDPILVKRRDSEVAQWEAA